MALLSLKSWEDKVCLISLGLTEMFSKIGFILRHTCPSHIPYMTINNLKLALIIVSRYVLPDPTFL